MERLRTDIAVAEAKDERINAQILNLQRRVQAEREKLVNDDYEDLLGMIERLKQLIPGIEREIDRQYYYCYGDGAVTVEEIGSVVVYIVRGESFANYLLSVYGNSVSAGTITRASYNFMKVDIFSPVWSSTFGYPMGSGAMDGSDFHFNGDFSCLNPSAAVSGQGVIS